MSTDLPPPVVGPPPGPAGLPLPPPPPPPRRSAWWIPVTAILVLAGAIGAVIAIAQSAGSHDDDAGRRPATTRPSIDAGTSPADVPERTSPTVGPGGDEFDDPQGTYTITTGPRWRTVRSPLAVENEFWAVADEADGFTPNVNVLTQAAPGVSQEEYMTISLDGLGGAGLELLDHAFVTGPTGDRLGLIEYTGKLGSPIDLHFVGVFAMRGDTAVVATFTSPVDRFDDLWPAVEPYLLTLRAAS